MKYDSKLEEARRKVCVLRRLQSHWQIDSVFQLEIIFLVGSSGASTTAIDITDWVG